MRPNPLNFEIKQKKKFGLLDLEDDVIMVI
jgi:hypothetical protein